MILRQRIVLVARVGAKQIQLITLNWVAQGIIGSHQRRWWAATT